MKPIIYSAALLFLCSCNQTPQAKTDPERTRDLIDNVISMEEQLQLANVMQCDRGSAYKWDVHSELSTIMPSGADAAKYNKLQSTYKVMQAIDEETGNLLSGISALKLDLLKSAGENLTKSRNNPDAILLTTFDPQDEPLPARFNLAAIRHKENTTAAGKLFTSEGGPSGTGLKLWNGIDDLRNKLVELVGTYTSNDRSFEIRPTAINDYRTTDELAKKVSAMLESSGSNHPEDDIVLRKIYMDLSKPEKIQTPNGQTVHWVCKSFHGVTIVEAIAVLTSLEQQILSARTLAIAHLKSRVSTGEYTFSKLMPLATGPEFAKKGETVRIRVFMAAVNDEQSPVVTLEDKAGKSIAYPQDGTGIVTFKAAPGLQTIRGTISIRNKSGLTKTESWQWTVNGVN